MISKYIPIL